MAQKFEDEDVEVTPRKRKMVDEDEVETPRKRKMDDDEDERPRKKVVDEEDERPAKKSAKKDDDEDSGPVGMDVDFGDEKIARRKGKIERIQASEGRPVRFALIPGFKVKAADTHYIDGKGTFICNSTDEHEAACCKLFNGDQGSRANLRALALVVQYTNAKKDGTIPKAKDGSVEIEWEIKYIRMSRKNYNDIFKLKTEDETVYDFDIVMAENDNKIGYGFQRISNKAWWCQDEDLKAEILEAAEKFRDGKALTYYLGRKVDDLEYKTMARAIANKGKGSDEDEL